MKREWEIISYEDRGGTRASLCRKGKIIRECSSVQEAKDLKKSILKKERNSK